MSMNTSGYCVQPEELDACRNFVASLGKPALWIETRSRKQGWMGIHVGHGVGVGGGELKVNGRVFGWGISGHADCEIELRSSCALVRLRGFVGIEENPETVKAKRDSRAVFSIENEAGKCLWESRELSLTSAAQPFDIAVDGSRTLILKATGIGSLHGHLPYGHADWGELTAETATGEAVRIGDPSPDFTPDFLPMDFRFGDESMHEFLLRCGCRRRESGNAAVFEAFDPGTGLALEFTVERHDPLPVCEWRAVFSNRGTAPTPRLSGVKSLSLHFPDRKSESVRLLRGRGAFNTVPQNTASFNDSFLPVLDEIDAGTRIEFGAENGRCSDPWLPFFNLKRCGDGGMLFAVGWEGQWQAGAESRSVSAGIPDFDAVILPGERFEFPSIHMIRYSGGEMLRGNNLLRRFLREKIAPRDRRGAPILPPISGMTWGGMPEAEHLKRIDLIARLKLPFEVYWIDAGWYAPPSNSEFEPIWSAHVGDWSFHPDVLPHGTGPVADAAHQAGMKLLLWVEPERAIAGTKLPTLHPDWFLSEVKTGTTLLLDLGNEAACDWCIGYISELIEKHGVDVYREDFNIVPLPYWRANDAPDRRGVTELKAIAGLRRFWGELRRRFPDLLIDTCASGGRRIDIELLRFCIPLWSSDMFCYPDFDPDCAQTHVSGLSLWLPLFGNGSQDHEGGDTYHMRSCYGAGLDIHTFYRGDWPVREDDPRDWLKARLKEYKAVRDCFSGDFHPLLETIGHIREIWSASQYDRPDLGRGVVLVFRRKNSPFAAADLRLRGLSPDAAYEFHDFDSGRTWTVPGGELTRKGLRIEMPAPGSSRLISYQRLK